MERERVIDLVRKLFSKAESARGIGNADEAAAFADKANDLLIRHKLEQTELEMQDEGDNDPFARDDVLSEIWGGVRHKWSTNLVTAIARAHFCSAVFDRVVYARGGKITGRVSLIGRNSDREIVLFLIQTLHREAKRLAREAVKAGAHRTSFLMGFTTAIYKRLNERQAAVKQQGGQYAVVRLNDLESQLEQKVSELFGATSQMRSRASYIDGRSFEAGQAAGANVGLGGISSGHRNASRLLGGAK